jgi:hypothetical protein
LFAVEASIGTFRDDKEIMTLIVFGNKVGCHKGAVEKLPEPSELGRKRRKHRGWASRRSRREQGCFDCG